MWPEPSCPGLISNSPPWLFCHRSMDGGMGGGIGGGMDGGMGGGPITATIETF